MMAITFQTIGPSKIGLFLSLIRQGLFYLLFIPLLTKPPGCQPVSDKTPEAYGFGKYDWGYT